MINTIIACLMKLNYSQDEIFSPRMTSESIGRSAEKKHLVGKGSHEFEYDITYDTLREWTMHAALGAPLSTLSWSLHNYLKEYAIEMRSKNQSTFNERQD